MAQGIQAIVFDIGGVLLDWNPRHLYRRLFQADEAAMERFLAEVCTQDWNERQDAGRSFAEGVAELTAYFPHLAGLIRAYDVQWEEMLGGAIGTTVDILAAFRRSGMPLYALTNFSAEKFPLARRRFEFLDWFDGIVVSGEIGLVKPDPAIFRHLLQAFKLRPETTLFIDDSARNIDAAADLGFAALRYRGAAELAADLTRLGFDFAAGERT